MANTQRAALLTKAQKVLKQHAKPHVPPKERTLLEHLLYAACLENSSPQVADIVFQRLQSKYFDWNEVRVSTVTELAEAMGELFDSNTAAAQLKRVLQGVFEATYSYDLEQVKKQNLGVAVKQIEKMTGSNPFVMNYAVQNGLGGHAIPLDRGAWEVLVVTGIATAVEAATGSLSGLERTIPKNKGIEFFAALHQLGAEYLANPQSPVTRKVLTTINAAAVFPKRNESSLKLPDPKPVLAKAGKSDASKPGKEAAKPADKTKIDPKAKTDVKADGKMDKSKPAPAKDNKSHSKSVVNNKVEATKTAPKVETKEKNPAEKSGKVEAKKSSPNSAKGKPLSAVVKKSPNKQLAKRKPR